LSDKQKQFIVLILTVIFIAINSFLIAKDQYVFSLVPVGLLVIYFAFFRLEALIYIIVFFTPLSVLLSNFVSETAVDMYLPTEPLMFGIMIIFFMKLILERKFDKKIALHPVSIAIYFYMAWMCITTLTSTMPVISFKFLLSRMWFIVVFYFIGTQIFYRYRNMERYIWAYIAGFFIVIVYTITNHSQFGLFDQQMAHSVMRPFYNDHTSYGAMLAMFIPVLAGFAVIHKRSSNTWRALIWSMIPVFLFALLLSYSRAAWISVVVALVVFLIMLFRIRFTTLLVFAGVLAGLFFAYQTEIMLKLEQNRQDSSTDLAKHVKSISNISSDASNLERINRWQSALRMFREKPFLGWGPGTYAFQYAPFQFSYEKTIISTDFGDMGTAHSEYIGPLAESGVPGTLSFVAILVAVILTALKDYFRNKRRKYRYLALAVFLGLVTYYTHGFLNNFLDTDKASAPFWGFIAMLVAIDVYHRKEEEKTNKKIK
jgi:O-antigen ligase